MNDDVIVGVYLISDDKLYCKGCKNAGDVGNAIRDAHEESRVIRGQINVIDVEAAEDGGVKADSRHEQAYYKTFLILLRET